MVRQGLYIYVWLLVSNEGVSKFFDKLTVKPKSSESAAFVMDTPYHNELKVPAHAIAWIQHFPAKAWSGAQCVHLALSVRMLESVEPFRRLPSSDGFDDIN